MPGTREGGHRREERPGAGGRHAREFPARRGALPDVVRFVETVAAAAGLVREDGLRLVLVVEELFANTVCHGHGGDSDHPVRVAFETSPGEIRLTYEDAAPPFDLAARVRQVRHRPPGVPADVGGLGLVLIAALAAELGYARIGAHNRVWLRFRPDARPAKSLEPGRPVD